MRRAKLLKRLGAITSNSLRSVVLMLSGALIAWLVIRQSSAGVWGALVQDLIFISLSVHVLGWGNKEYLLRRFSQSPATLAAEFYGSLAVRSLGLAVPAALILWMYAPQFWPWMLLWLLANFFYQAFDVLVTYHRRFTLAGLIEIAGLTGVMAGLFYFKTSLDHMKLLQLVAGSYLLRAALLFLFVRMPANPDFDFSLGRKFLWEAFPFFILGLSGLLGSRMDLYVTNYFLSEQEVGEYQVIASIFVFLQAGAAFVLIPFAKNLYRLELPAIRKTSHKLFAIGLLLMVPGIVAAYVVLQYIYGFGLDLEYYLYGMALTIPSFYYLPVIYLLYKDKEEKKVLLINFMTALMTLVLTALLLPTMGNKGGLLGKALVQLIVLLLYLNILIKKSRQHAHPLPKL